MYDCAWQNVVPTYEFTGKERDGESGLDNFGARYYSSQYGRFMIPDWAAKATAVPYAEFNDPQTLNLYGYVRNNPLSRADADGHCFDPVSCGLEFAGGGSFFGPVGTGAGLVVGALVGTAIVLEAVHIVNSENTQSTSDTATQPTPDRTANDPLRRDPASGKAIPDPEAVGAPHTQLGTKDSKSQPGTSYPQAREFDANGKEVKRVDFTDHGRKDHPNPHEHVADPKTGKLGPPQPVTKPCKKDDGTC
jgi:RHS repeat-associated protein